jgi:hypothetical protein
VHEKRECASTDGLYQCLVLRIEPGQRINNRRLLLRRVLGQDLHGGIAVKEKKQSPAHGDDIGSETD